MSLYMDPTMEAFYTSLLAYAGLSQAENGDIINADPNFGDFTIDGAHIRLPYREYLKNPDGRSFFHLLNESYTSPETALFSLYKRRLVCELNIRLTELIMKLIRVASEPVLQQRIRSSATIELITQLGEVEMDQIESVTKLMKASRKVNDEGFMFDIFLKKNGQINDTSYAAIGKVNFHTYKEIQNSLQLKDSDYKAFGTKIGKKNLLVLETIFQTIFPDIDTPEAFYTGTNFKGFRYLNVLLKTSYQISHRINEIVEQLEEIKEPSLELESVRCDLNWATVLEDLYGMMDKIRMIPNQNNPKADAHHRLNVTEPQVEAATPAPARPDYQAPQPYTPTPQPAPQPNAYQPQPAPQPAPQPMPQQPQQPAVLSPEDIVRRGMQQYPMQGGYPQQPGMPGGYPQQPMPAGFYQPQPGYPTQPMAQYQQPQPMPAMGTVTTGNDGRQWQLTPQGWVPFNQYQAAPGYPQASRPLDPFLMARSAAPM